MRVFILLGLLFIAWALNYELMEPMLNKPTLLILVGLAAIMDTSEYLKNMLNKK